MNGELPQLYYDRTTIALHWLVAAAVVLQWLGAHAIDWFPKGPTRIDARSVHIVGGAILAAVVAFRLYWRARRGARPPPTQAGLMGALAAVMHRALIVNLLILIGLGLFLARVRGDSLFSMTRIPAFGNLAAQAHHVLANRVTDLHSLAANAMLLLAGVHAAVALAHHFYWKDDVLKRMLSPAQDLAP